MIGKLFNYLVLSFFLTGCGSLGPHAMKGERNNYNVVIQNTNDQQLLLNLVRLQYRDTPLFLEVSGISTQFTFLASAEVSASLPDEDPNAVDLGGSALYSEQPTFSYTPLQGEAFNQRFLSPIDSDRIRLLFHSGWRADRILSISVQRMNDIYNAPSASGPTPDYVPRYQKFTEVAHLFRELQVERALDFVYQPNPNDPEQVYLAVQIHKDFINAAQTNRLRKLLGLSPGKNQYPIINDMTLQDPDYIRIETRSLLGLLFYLSQSVEAPIKDRELGLVTTTLDKQGLPFDWKKVTGSILTIHSASVKPSHAAVSIRYRGSWFYIDDRDLNSKSTFSLLSQIFELQAGDIESMRPVITLPIGG